MRPLCLTLPLALLPALALAADPAAAPLPLATEPGLLWPVVKMLGALALVVGILLLVHAAQKRGFGLLPGLKEGQIRILESRPLGARKYLCRVQVRERELLLGVTADRIVVLDRLDGPPSFARTLEDVETPQ